MCSNLLSVFILFWSSLFVVCGSLLVMLLIDECVWCVELNVLRMKVLFSLVSLLFSVVLFFFLFVLKCMFFSSVILLGLSVCMVWRVLLLFGRLGMNFMFCLSVWLMVLVIGFRLYLFLGLFLGCLKWFISMMLVLLLSSFLMVGMFVVMWVLFCIMLFLIGML